MSEANVVLKQSGGAPASPVVSIVPQREEQEVFYKKVVLRCAKSLNPLPKEVQNETIIRLGAFFAPNERTPFRSLSKQELSEVSEELFGMATTAQDYAKAAETFFAEFAPRIPFDEGLSIEVPIDQDGNIVFKREYMYDIMIYRHSLAHPYVANSPDEYEALEANGKMLAYIEDREAAKKGQIVVKNVAKKAMQYYIDVVSVGNENKLNYILEVLAAGVKSEKGLFTPSVLEGVLNVKTLDGDTKDLAIEETIKVVPATFVSLYDDPDLQVKSLLNRLLRYKIFKRDGNIIVYENETIGIDDDEAIAKLRAESFSEQLVSIKAKLKAAEKIARSF